MTIVIVILILLQLISFYIMALLYMKMTKLNEIEQTQRKLMAEMEDAIAAYITELKDENDRFLQHISTPPKSEQPSPQKTVDSFTQSEELLFERPKIPVKQALHTYHKNAVTPITVDELTGNKEETAPLRTSVSQLASEGYSVEEIAKQLGVGKTEVELLLKFRVRAE